MLQYRFWGWAIICLVAVAGCASWDWNKPEVTVADIQMQSRKGFEQNLRVMLHVQNPNNKPLPIGGMTMTLNIHGKAFATGVNHDGVTIEPLGEATIPVDVTVNLLKGAGVVFAMWREHHDVLDYRLIGDVYVGDTLSFTLPFENRGQLKLKD